MDDSPLPLGPFAKRTLPMAAAESTTSAPPNLSFAAMDLLSRQLHGQWTPPSASSDIPGSSEMTGCESSVQIKREHDEMPEEDQIHVKMEPSEENQEDQRPHLDKKHKLDKEPLNHLLKGMTFCLSGLKNPQRAELRQKALDMGATYSANWTMDCTMDGLKGNSQSKDSKHGLILTPNYIEACHHHRSRLPLLDFLLATGESFVDELKPFLDTIKPEPKSDDDRDEFNSKSSDGDDDDSDSEDEEDDQKVQKRKMDPEKEEAWLQSIAFASPPQDESHITPQKLEDFIKYALPLADLFTGLIVYLDTCTLSPETVSLMKRYIIAYDGSISEQIEESNVVCTYSMDEDEGIRVRPEWVLACHASQARLEFF